MNHCIGVGIIGINAKRPREPLTLMERILVLVVVVAIGCFEVWFFFFAGSSLPNQ